MAYFRGNGEVTGCTFVANHATASGGGLFLGEEVTLTNSVFAGNVSDSAGGGLFIQNGTGAVPSTRRTGRGSGHDRLSPVDPEPRRSPRISRMWPSRVTRLRTPQLSLLRTPGCSCYLGPVTQPRVSTGSYSSMARSAVASVRLLTRAVATRKRSAGSADGKPGRSSLLRVTS